MLGESSSFGRGLINQKFFFFFGEDFDYFIHYEFNLFGHFVKMVKVLGDKQLLLLKRTTNIIFIFHNSLSPTRVNCEKRYLVYKLSDFIYSLLYEKKKSQLEYSYCIIKKEITLKREEGK